MNEIVARIVPEGYEDGECKQVYIQMLKDRILIFQGQEIVDIRRDQWDKLKPIVDKSFEVWNEEYMTLPVDAKPDSRDYLRVQIFNGSIKEAFKNAGVVIPEGWFPSTSLELCQDLRAIMGLTPEDEIVNILMEEIIDVIQCFWTLGFKNVTGYQLWHETASEENRKFRRDLAEATAWTVIPNIAWNQLSQASETRVKVLHEQFKRENPYANE